MDDLQKRSDVVLKYIPRTLYEWYSKEKQGIHKISNHKGVILLIDASGFTEITSSLMNRGKEGSEIITSLMNRLFDNLALVIDEYHGDILKFAGDALWIYFEDPPDPSSIGSDIFTALDRINTLNLKDGFPELAIHMGAEYGNFNLLSMGDKNSRLEVEPSGKVITSAERACSFADKGQFLVGPSYRRLFNASVNQKKLKNGFSLAGSLNNYSESRLNVSKEYFHLPVRNWKYLEYYLPEQIRDRIKDSGGSEFIPSEYRNVTVCFVNLEFLSEVNHENYTKKISPLVEKCFQLVHKKSGIVARIDPYQKGYKLLILFGAPVKNELDEVNALRCASDILELTDETFRMRIGIAYGQLFCGNVGTKSRQEYTVMGESVNLAARLMSGAKWNQILLDENLRMRLPDAIQSTPIELRLKGISDIVYCYKFIRILDHQQETAQFYQVIGLKHEKDLIQTIWEKAQSNSLHTVFISGPPGCGKTLFIGNLLSEIESSRGSLITCRNSVLYNQGQLAAQLLKMLYEKQDELSQENLQEYVEDIVDKRWLPLISGLMGKEVEDNQWTFGLPPDLRMQKRKDLYRQIVKSFLKDPQTVFIDDIDSADEYSRNLFLSLAGLPDNVPLMLGFISREKEAFEEFKNKLSGFTDVDIKYPSSKEWLMYFNSTFEMGKREEELFAQLMKTSGGNPHFVLSYLNRLIEQEQVATNPFSGKWEISDSDFQISIPERLSGLHVAMIDGLSEKEKNISKTLAVARFDLDKRQIAGALREEPENLKDSLENLVTVGILKHNSISGKYRIQSITLMESAYSCISRSKLKKNHEYFAKMLEDQPDSPIGLRAYHYYNAGISEQGFACSLAAARESFRYHSISDSAQYYKQCLEISKQAVNIDPDLLYEFYYNHSRFLQLEGRYSEAFKAFRVWRIKAKSDKNVHQYLLANLHSARLLWSKSKYRYCKVFLDKVLSYQNKIDDDQVFARAYAIRSELERRTGNFKEARQSSLTSIALAEQTGDIEIRADGHNNLGLALWAEGDLEEAAESFKRYLHLGKETDGIYAQAQTSNNLAIIYWEMGNFKSAISLLNEALKIFSVIGDKHYESYASGNLASLYRIAGKFQDAHKLFQKADSIFTKLDDRHAHFYTIGNIADIELICGEVEKAEEQFYSVNEFARSVNDQELETECQIRFGELRFCKRDFSESENIFRKAINAAKKIGSLEYHMRAEIGLTRVFIAKRNASDAMVLITKLMTQADESKSDIIKYEALFLKGECHRLLTENEIALELYKDVYDYSKAQDVFELKLKSVIRLYEIEENLRDKYFGILHEIQTKFENENQLLSWKKIASSRYFSFFAPLINSIVDSDHYSASEHI